jgi:hypothetical protein
VPTTWSIEERATVVASPEEVMGWWLHPDRRDDFRDRTEGRGATNFSVTETITDGLRVRTFSWTDRRGWEHQNQIETSLDSNGMAPRRGDRFVADTHDTIDLRGPKGQATHVDCTGRVEFIPLNSGSTEVRMLHNHSLDGGGNWLRRRMIRDADRQHLARVFRQMIEKCQASIDPSSRSRIDPQNKRRAAARFVLFVVGVGAAAGFVTLVVTGVTASTSKRVTIQGQPVDVSVLQQLTGPPSVLVELAVHNAGSAAVTGPPFPFAIVGHGLYGLTYPASASGCIDVPQERTNHSPLPPGGVDYTCAEFDLNSDVSYQDDIRSVTVSVKPGYGKGRVTLSTS